MTDMRTAEFERLTTFTTLDLHWVDSTDAAKLRYTTTGVITCRACKKALNVGSNYDSNARSHASSDPSSRFEAWWLCQWLSGRPASEVSGMNFEG